MRVFDFKSFYSIYKEALIDDNQTAAVASLFSPILSLRFFPANIKDKDDKTPLVIDSRKASEWAVDPKRSVRGDVARFAQTAKAESSIIDHFENVIIPNELDDNELDQMIENMLDYALDSQLNKAQKDKLSQLVADQDVGEFLARSFIFSLIPNKTKKAKVKTEQSTRAVEEFHGIVLDKRKKPQAVVPEKVDEVEAQLEYVKALLGVYEEATGDEYVSPDDVKDTIYEDHFHQQRKSYYQAEAIHRAVRDSETEDDEDFEVLKDEIKDGIYYVSHRKYPRGIDKADAVLEKASDLPISHNTDKNMLGWVGPCEKQGVCHMLVNDRKLTWIEDNSDEK